MNVLVVGCCGNLMREVTRHLAKLPNVNLTCWDWNPSCDIEGQTVIMADASDVNTWEFHSDATPDVIILGTVTAENPLINPKESAIISLGIPCNLDTRFPKSRFIVLSSYDDSNFGQFEKFRDDYIVDNVGNFTILRFPEVVGLDHPTNVVDYLRDNVRLIGTLTVKELGLRPMLTVGKVCEIIEAALGSETRNQVLDVSTPKATWITTGMVVTAIRDLYEAEIIIDDAKELMHRYWSTQAFRSSENKKITVSGMSISDAVHVITSDPKNKKRTSLKDLVIEEEE